MESSSFGRLFGVLFSPVRTFRSIAERPTWLVPLLAIALAASLVAFLAGKRTDYRDMIVQSSKDRGQQTTEAQLEPAISMMEKAGPIIGAVSTPVVLALITLLMALLYWVAFKLLGSDFSYKSSLAVTLHSWVPAVLSLLLSIPVILSRSTIGYADMKRSGGTFLQSNLAFLAPEDAPGWLIALFASVDFFSLWVLVLSIIGFRAVTGKPARPVAITVIVIWLLFVGVRVGWAALFG
ncbi:MAG TPA: YIP1 family protein [Thermoanaerobaculia bacterium]|nr:YIP1 family protein [Thermoanaerobaculia bacterium]